MAKKEGEGEQLELIDVDDPKLKDVKKELLAYDKLKEANKEQGSAGREAEKSKRQKVLAAIIEAGVKPDAEGVYHLTFAGKQWDIRQDNQLKIKKHKAPAAGDGGDAPDAE